MTKTDLGTDVSIRTSKQVDLAGACEYSQSNYSLLKFPLSRYKRAVKHPQADGRIVEFSLTYKGCEMRCIGPNSFLISS